MVNELMFAVGMRGMPTAAFGGRKMRTDKMSIMMQGSERRCFFKVDISVKMSNKKPMKMPGYFHGYI